MMYAVKAGNLTGDGPLYGPWAHHEYATDYAARLRNLGEQATVIPLTAPKLLPKPKPVRIKRTR